MRQYDDDDDDRADRLYDEIHQGDRQCIECGNPSYMMFRNRIYCHKHYQELRQELVSNAVKFCCALEGHNHDKHGKGGN